MRDVYIAEPYRQSVEEIDHVDPAVLKHHLAKYGFKTTLDLGGIVECERTLRYVEEGGDEAKAVARITATTDGATVTVKYWLDGDPIYDKTYDAEDFGPFKYCHKTSTAEEAVADKIDNGLAKLDDWVWRRHGWVREEEAKA